MGEGDLVKDIDKKERQSTYKLNTDEYQEPSEESRELFLGEWKFRKIVGAVIVLSFLFLVFFRPGISTDAANKTVSGRISNYTSAGEKMFLDEVNAGIVAKEFTVSGLKEGDGGGAKMLIWDFNHEDGDQVQILVNGQPIHEPFVLTNSPAAFSVPAVCVVTIEGVRDGGGGISYAVKFPQKKMTIFNVVPLNGINTYHLVP
jgi:hypothetical protein